MFSRMCYDMTVITDGTASQLQALNVSTDHLENIEGKCFSKCGPWSQHQHHLDIREVQPRLSESETLEMEPRNRHFNKPFECCWWCWSLRTSYLRKDYGTCSDLSVFLLLMPYSKIKRTFALSLQNKSLVERNYPE